MPNERPRTDLVPLNLALAIMLAIAGGIQTWNNFNDSTAREIANNRTEIAVLKEQVAVLQSDLRELRERGHRDGSR